MVPNPRKRPVQWTTFTEVLPANSEGEGQTFINSLYQVTVHHQRSSGYTWLAIVRRDRRPVHDWRHLQRIKNEICGPDREAVEIYPSEARLVDTSNQYHLWVLPLGETVNLGFAERDVSETVVGAHKQRPFDVPPPDLGRPTSVGLRTPVMFPTAQPRVVREVRGVTRDALLRLLDEAQAMGFSDGCQFVRVALGEIPDARITQKEALARCREELEEVSSRRLLSDALLAETVKLARRTGVSEETMLDQLGLTGWHRQHVQHLANPAQPVKGEPR